MASGWDNVLRELKDTMTPSDYVRKKYIKSLSDLTKRNTISYYSAFLNQNNVANLDINDSDMTGFMNAVQGLDCEKGLDLVLHTPGGDPAAAESIIKYLRIKFNNDIRILVPHMAMSAGTMMACAGKEIIMGKQSSLGPIDPQFNGIPAYNIKSEFEDAKEDLANNPQNATYWAIKLQQYPAAFMKTALDAIELSDKLVKEWLGTCMFDAKRDYEKINRIASGLNEHDESKIHGRHFNIERCKEIGLKIIALEDDGNLQDALLGLHHAYMLTFGASHAVKVIENQEGKAYIVSSS